MKTYFRIGATFLLCAGMLLSPATFATTTAAQDRERRSSTDQEEKKTWPSGQTSIVRKAGEAKESPQLSSEPVMRIALSTGTRSAAISTTAKLLNASESNTAALPLQTARVRVESRLLSPSSAAREPAYDLEIANSLARDEADRMIDSVRQQIGESAHAIPDSTSTWRVVVSSKSLEDANTVSAKLEDAGFEILSLHEAGVNQAKVAAAGKAPASPAQTVSLASANRLRLTARAIAPGREVIAFAGGAAALVHSSAPLVFASSDEANAPVRFNDKPFRGKIEVFANTRGALTVVNVIGLEDYVRGVVPNELSPGGYPAIEALKAQAIAARTYALKNQGQYAADGYDLLPTTRSQVYRGLSSEHPLSSRAVEETRGMIATYNGEPINALYTSTCGGRTEDAGNIFNHAVPYLRGRECAVEGKAALAPFLIKSSRELFEIKDEKDLAYARDAALLEINGFHLAPDRISSAWLASHLSESEAREWLMAANRLARTPPLTIPNDVTRPPGFSTALMAAVFGDKRADTLLNNVDADYLLGFHDGEQVPAVNRADVAMLLRDGALSLRCSPMLLCGQRKRCRGGGPCMP